MYSVLAKLNRIEDMLNEEALKTTSSEYRSGLDFEAPGPKMAIDPNTSRAARAARRTGGPPTAPASPMPTPARPASPTPASPTPASPTPVAFTPSLPLAAAGPLEDEGMSESELAAEEAALIKQREAAEAARRRREEAQRLAEDLAEQEQRAVEEKEEALRIQQEEAVKIAKAQTEKARIQAYDDQGKNAFWIANNADKIAQQDEIIRTARAKQREASTIASSTRASSTEASTRASRTSFTNAASIPDMPEGTTVPTAPTVTLPSGSRIPVSDDQVSVMLTPPVTYDLEKQRAQLISMYYKEAYVQIPDEFKNKNMFNWFGMDEKEHEDLFKTGKETDFSEEMYSYDARDVTSSSFRPMIYPPVPSDALINFFNQRTNPKFNICQFTTSKVEHHEKMLVEDLTLMGFRCGGKGAKGASKTNSDIFNSLKKKLYPYNEGGLTTGRTYIAECHTKVSEYLQDKDFRVFLAKKDNCLEKTKCIDWTQYNVPELLYMMQETIKYDKYKKRVPANKIAKHQPSTVDLSTEALLYISMDIELPMSVALCSSAGEELRMLGFQCSTKDDRFTAADVTLHKQYELKEYYRTIWHCSDQTDPRTTVQRIAMFEWLINFVDESFVKDTHIALMAKKFLRSLGLERFERTNVAAYLGFFVYMMGMKSTLMPTPQHNKPTPDAENKGIPGFYMEVQHWLKYHASDATKRAPKTYPPENMIFLTAKDVKDNNKDAGFSLYPYGEGFYSNVKTKAFENHIAEMEKKKKKK